MDQNSPEDHHFQRSSPPWWPAGEPWPPQGSPNWRYWRSRRAHFFRRVGCFGVIILLLLAGLFSGLVWLTARTLQIIPLSPESLQRARIIAIFLPILFFFGIGWLALVVRRTAIPVGKILEAVGKVADGDYTVRIPERRPGESLGLVHAFNQMAQRLEATDKERRKTLADVTHELRTPITIIQGNLEGILDGIYPADPMHIEAILDETRVLSRVIDDLRTLSLAESGAIKLEYEPVVLADLVTEVAASFQSQAGEKGVALSMEVPSDIPTLELDPVRIREVLVNLVANALRYTPRQGTITIRAWEDTNKRVFVQVNDSGSGISPEDLPHIFDRFYKTSDSRGTGLGLAIAKNLIAAHGGEISARSESGNGTQIEFWLPIN